MKVALGRFAAEGPGGTLKLLRPEDVAAHDAATDEIEQIETRRYMNARAVAVSGVLLTMVCADCGGSGELPGETTEGADSSEQPTRRTRKQRKAEASSPDAIPEAMAEATHSVCFGCINSPVPGRVCVEVSLGDFLTAVFNPQALR